MNESVRESTKALVRSLGYNARAFASAEEFLESDLDDSSCLILDVQMKGLSGVELQERLIAQGRYKTKCPDSALPTGFADCAVETTPNLPKPMVYSLPV